MTLQRLHAGVAGTLAVIWIVLAATTPLSPDPTEFLRVPDGWDPSPAIVGVWALGLIALCATHRWPLAGVGVLFVFEYGVPRYTLEYQHMLALGLPELTAALTLGGWLVWQRTHQRPIGSREAWLIPALMVLLAAWVAVSALTTAASGSVWLPSRTQHPSRFAVALAMLLITASTLRSSLGYLSGVAVFWGALVLRTLLTPGGVRLDGDVGALVAVAAPLAALPLLIGRWWVRWLGGAGVCALLGLLALTRNRGGVVGLAAAMLTMATLAPRWTLRAAAATTLLVALAVPLSSTEFRSRFEALWTNGIRSGSAGERLELWDVAGRMLASHPVAGIGPGNFASRVGEYEPGLARLGAHNTIVAMFAETGWVGGLLFCALFAAGLGLAVRMSWAGSGWRQTAAMALGASLAGYLGAGMFVGRQTQVVAYVLLGAVAALVSRYSTDS